MARRKHDVDDEERRARPAAMACLAALALALTGCTTGTGDEPTTSPSVTPSVTASVTPSPSPTTTPTSAPAVVPAYFMIDTRNGLRLAREQRTVTGSDPVQAAVETMIAGPIDPDYTTTWNPATTVLGTSRVDGAIVVDLSADARTANVGSEGAALMIQQLVYTATGAAGEPTTPVLLRIDGKSAGELWGVVAWDAPVTREDPISVRLLVQIDAPAEGATTTSPLHVTGEAAVFEAVLHWVVLDAGGVEVSSGVTMTAEGQTFAPYAFEVELTPGAYTVVITEDDPSDGAGGTPMSDSRAVTVT
jgi:hypothetical protein